MDVRLIRVVGRCSGSDANDGKAAKVSTMGAGWYPPDHPKHVPGLGFNTHATRALKGVGPKWDSATKSGAHGMKRWTNPAEDGRKQKGSGEAWWDKALNERRKEATALKVGGDWFGKGNDMSLMRQHNSKSTSRKFASALIAKIPLALSRHIGAVFRPNGPRRAGTSGTGMGPASFKP